jgi:hypothetical protein
MVSLWPAKLTNLNKEIVLSPENEAYDWLELPEAIISIKEQYAGALQQADNIIRAIENQLWYNVILIIFHYFNWPIEICTKPSKTD